MDSFGLMITKLNKMTKQEIAEKEIEAFKWMKEKGYDRRACKDIAPILVKYGIDQLSIPLVSNRLSEMEEAGKEATSLIAHLKDQHGFNEVEEEAQNKIMKVFKYEGRW